PVKQFERLFEYHIRSPDASPLGSSCRSRLYWRQSEASMIERVISGANNWCPNNWCHRIIGVSSFIVSIPNNWCQFISRLVTVFLLTPISPRDTIFLLTPISPRDTNFPP